MFTRSLAWLFSAGLLVACSQDSDSDREGPLATAPGNAEVVEFPAIEAEPGDPSAHPPAGKTPSTNANDPARANAQPGGFNTRDLIEELLSFDWDGDAQDDQRVDALLLQLRMQGADALVAIRDFLLDGESSAAAPPSLRQALLEMLLGLGVPQFEEVALELLAGGLPPAELWQVGHYLESVQPGGYTDLILQAAERALIEAGPDTYFPAEFFQFVGKAGDQDTALVLAETQSERGAYATLALASLPDGVGIASLERDARVFESGQEGVGIRRVVSAVLIKTRQITYSSKTPGSTGA